MAGREVDEKLPVWGLPLAFAILFAGPLFGLIGGLWLCYDYAVVEAAAHAPALFTLCWRLPFQWETVDLCGDYQHAVVLAVASAGVIAALLALAGLIVLGGALARRSVAFLVAAFPPAARLLFIAAALVVLVQGLLLAYGAFIFLDGSISLQLVAPLGAIWGAIAAAFLLLRAAVSVFRLPPLKIRGILLDRTAQPRLWAEVDGIAGKMAAPAPRQIAAGLGGSFFAVDMPVVISGDTTVTGETLYLPLPLLRALDAEELRAVIAHELAHFKGGETAWGKRLAPVLMGLEDVIESSRHGIVAFAMLPAAWLIGLFSQRFGAAIFLHQRRRELEADRQAATIIGGRPLATALVRLMSVQAVARAMERAQARRKLDPDQSQNLCEYFVHWVKDHAAKRDGAAFLEKASAGRLSHPTDEHPPLRDRFVALGITPPGEVAWMDLPSVQSTALLDGAEALERQLSAQDTAFFGDFVNQPMELVPPLRATAEIEHGAEGKPAARFVTVSR